MKKRILTLLSVLFFLLTGNAVTVNVATPGSLNSVIANRLITNLTITGTIDARDFKFMRDSMPNLAIVDMPNATIATYTGNGGTSDLTSDTYAANIIPAFAFCDPVTTTGKTSLNSITFPNNITGIEYEAFEGCANLHQQLVIPNGVTYINDMAFYLCSGLNGVLDIPASVTTLGFHAFEGASGISKINIPPTTTDITAGCIDITPMTVNVDPANPAYVAINDFLFTKDMALLMHGPSYITGKYTVPASVTAIAFHCFEKCTTLGETVFPPNLKHIGSGAFYYCSDMTQELKFPQTLEMISDQAFEGCENITGTLQFPPSQISVGNSAFKGCSGLNGSLIFNDSLATIGNAAFDGCTGITGSVTIPPLVKKLGNMTFKNCKGITSVTIPNNVSTIGSEAFSGCSGLITVTEERPTPVTITSNVFKNVDQSNTTLFVPDGSKSLYKNSPVWKDFKYIIEGKGFRPVDTLVNVGKTAGSNGTTNIVANTTWAATSNATWLTVNPTGPTNGNGPLIITSLTKNPFITPRIATITITTTEGKTQDITIVQAAGDPSLDVSSLTSMVAKEAGAKANITVFSNTTWSALSDQAWLTVSPASATNDGILTFITTQPNPFFATRTANVTISAPGAASKTVVVTQSDKITLMFTPEPLLTTSKTYDKSATAKVVLGVMSGVDPLYPDVNVTASASYDDANAGTGKSITVKYLMTGNDAGKYFCPTDYSALGEIIPIKITVTAQTDSKTYDGNNASAKAPIITGALINPDVIDAQPIQNFDNKNAGTNKKILASGMIINDGNSGKNYSIDYVANNSGLISPVLITITAQTDNKTYDGTTASNVAPLLTGNIIAPDKIDSVAKQNFDTRRVGVNKSLIPSGLVINDGNSGNNYQIIYTPNNTGVIRKADVLIVLTASTRADDKEYDGTTKATLVNAKLNGIITGDDVNIDSIIGGFAQTTIGNDIPVNVTLTIKGIDAFNYTIKQPSGLVANITRKTLTVINTLGDDKTYDGNAVATIKNSQIVGVVGTEDVTLTNTSTGTFVQANAGNNIGITTNFGLAGNDIANYQLTQPTDVKANIKPLQTTTTGAPTTLTLSKVYDATTDAFVIPASVTNVLGADIANVSLAATANYDNANVGTNKTITVKYALTGSAASNYTTHVDFVSNLGSITPKQLSISGTKVANKKMYDGNSDAQITKNGALQGVCTPDTNNVTCKSVAKFDNSSVGINKAITIQFSLSGSASSNYLAPIDSTLNDGNILEHIQLSPIEGTSSTCEGSELGITYTLQSGEASKYMITFDTAAIDAGMKNIAYTPLASTGKSGTINITIPADTKSGTYHGMLKLANEYGGESPAYDFVFTINLSSDLIVSKFDDVVICDNSSRKFNQYQWYKNNEPISGATEQFYYDAKGLVGVYSLKVNTVDGKTEYICAKEYNKPKIQKIKVTPNVLHTNQDFKIEIVGYKESELNSASLTIYNAQGIEVYKTNQVKEINELNLDIINGIYLGRLKTSKGESHTFEIIISN